MFYNILNLTYYKSCQILKPFIFPLHIPYYPIKGSFMVYSVGKIQD